MEAGPSEAFGDATPVNTVLVHVPRDPDELDVVLGVVRWSYEFACGMMSGRR